MKFTKFRTDVAMDSCAAKSGLTNAGKSFATISRLSIQLYQGDNGRVIGYDNRHGYHHRHYFGTVEAVTFQSFEEIEARFEADWLALRNRQ